MSLTISAALAPMMLKISGSFSPSALSTTVWTWTSLYQPLGKSGRMGRSVEPAGEDFLFGGTAFALEVAAGEFAGGGGFFAVIHGQGEEVLAFLGLGGGDGGHDDDGFAELDGYGAVGLFGEFAGFNDDLLVAHLGGYFF